MYTYYAEAWYNTDFKLLHPICLCLVRTINGFFLSNTCWSILWFILFIYRFAKLVHIPLSLIPKEEVIQARGVLPSLTLKTDHIKRKGKYLSKSNQPRPRISRFKIEPSTIVLRLSMPTSMLNLPTKIDYFIS